LLLLSQEFACNGTVVEHPEYGEVIQLQGDQRQNISKFLKQVGLAREDQIKVSILHYASNIMALTTQSINYALTILSLTSWATEKFRSFHYISLCAAKLLIGNFVLHEECCEKNFSDGV
jgi:Translation initiation factor SUI1